MSSIIDRRRLPAKACLYHDGAAQTLDLEAISGHLRSLFPRLGVTIRGDLAAHLLDVLPESERPSRREEMARILASLRLHDPRRILDPVRRPEPMFGEIEFERRQLNAPHSTSGGILYEGTLLASTMADFLPPEESNLQHLHIAFTRRLFATWEPGDGRYHARVIILAYPSLISTSGIVEAPARPREYYVLRRHAEAGGPGMQALIEWEHTNSPRFIDHDDERLTDALKGYVMQAFLFHVTGDPFCADLECCLLNAHWQEELIRAQLGDGPRFCAEHTRLIEDIAAEYDRP
jgi:hypothetical protein